MGLGYAIGPIMGSVLYSALGFKVTFYTFGTALVLFAIGMRLCIPERKHISSASAKPDETELSESLQTKQVGTAGIEDG